MSSIEVEQKTDSIDRETNEQIWQAAYLHSAAFRLECSEGKMAAPAIMTY